MVTSARPRLRRAAEPLKITSVISPPRRLLALCSPSTQRTASTTFDLPEPFGPTMPVIPAGKSNCVLSANDLKPTISRRLSMACYQGCETALSRAVTDRQPDSPRPPLARGGPGGHFAENLFSPFYSFG